MRRGSVPARAKSARKITGSIMFYAPEWGPPESLGVRIWMQYNVREVDPDTQLAEGQCAWKIYNELLGWRYLVARVDCVTFGEDVGQDPQTAVLSGQITSKEGWGPGVPGEWFRFWVCDGGTLSSNVDQWSSQTYGEFPDEFWPEDEPPGCAYFDPNDPGTPFSHPPFDIEEGNLVIHH